VAEEEAENLEASPEEEEEEDESMDEAEGSLPSLGKRRSTDTALSGQTSAKRSRPGSLAEVGLPSLRKEKKRKEKKRKEKKRKEKKRKEKKRKEKKRLHLLAST